MAANNTPLYDLIELSGVSAYTSYTTSGAGGGTILGIVDDAVYTDGDHDNSTTQIGELNETASSNGGTFRIDGVTYSFEIVAPDGGGNDVDITHDGGTTSLGGGGFSSDIVFLILSPTGGGPDRYFALVDDTVGDLTGITSLTTRGLDFDPAGDDVKINADQDNEVTICFAAGTRIATPAGPRPVELLRPGDLVETLDHGARLVRWHHGRHVDAGAVARQRPVRIAPGALGPGMPARTLLLSPQHRVLVASPVTERMFGAAQILVPALRLVGHPGITRPDWTGALSYHNLHLGTHEVLLAEGAPVESLLRAPMSLRALPPLARLQLLRASGAQQGAARPIERRAARLRGLLRRHLRNRMPLVGAGTLMPAALARAGG